MKRHECRFGKDSLATEEFLSEHLCGKAFLFKGYLQKIIVAQIIEKRGKQFHKLVPYGLSQRRTGCFIK